MTQYQAPKPTYTKWEWFTYITSRVILFPWYATSYFANLLLGGLISRAVHPAAHDDELVEYSKQINASLHTTEKFQVKTHDGVILEGIQIEPSKPSIQTQASKPHPYIINFVGNGMCAQHIIEDMQKDADDLNATVIGFNFRGVGESTGPAARSSQNLVIDGIAQVQRLLNQGVPAKQIVLKGHSLGAGIATLVAAHFHRQGQEINVFNGRSFSSITNFVVGQIRVAGSPTGHQETPASRFWGWVAKPFIWLGVNLVGWEIDAASAYLELPKGSREHMVVRSSKKTREELGDKIIDDSVIPHAASLHYAVKGYEPKEEHKRHKVEACKPAENGSYYLVEGHNESWDNLRKKPNPYAHSFFKSFVERAVDNSPAQTNNPTNN